MKFLFNTDKKVFVSEQSGNTILDKRFRNGKTVVMTRNSIKENYIKNIIDRTYEGNKNPYLKLIEDFSSGSKMIKASDLVYLRDIGVYPINRLFILRRFPSGAIMRPDLDMGYSANITPISTIVGWVKDDKDFLNFSFGENWVKQGSDKMLHKLVTDILANEFGIKINDLVPIPGWGLGFVFGILNKMGLTSWTQDNLPIGNPNLLKESITRDHEDFGLSSSFNFNLETVYEQKFVNGIDPTFAVNEILKNVLNMGSSDTVYLGNASSSIIQNLRRASLNPTNSNAWSKFIVELIGRFSDALNSELKDVVSSFSQLKNKDKTEANDKNTAGGGDNIKNAFGITGSENNYSYDASSSILKTILASTVARYSWPLRGSIGMFTGEATTPWHLTIGNPYAPIISMSNVYLKNIDVSYQGEMLYNDIPKFINVKLSLEQGRNMGKNEIYDMFGIKYKRSYQPNNSIKIEQTKTEGVEFIVPPQNEAD